MRAVPRRNRVQPDGDIIADPARGLFTGNRGILVDRDGRMTNRQWASKAWITCLLAFRGWRRPIAQPGTWTELFFLDEAVALAAGHRPCAFCRRADYNLFKSLCGGLQATELDAVLHAERLQKRCKRLHDRQVADLPDGAFMVWNGTPHLVQGGAIYPYSPAGYGAPLTRPDGPASCLTPPSSLAVLAAGYRPRLHPSAATLRPR